MRLVDYVVAHELVHLRFPDHTRDFWAALGQVMSDYEERREGSDNGPCYVAKDLGEFLKKREMGHTRGRPYHPVTQGKIERITAR